MVKVIVIALVALVVGLVVLQQIDPNLNQGSADNTSLIENDDSTLSVTIEGQVALPGIYKLDISLTLQDLINSAGGLLESADTDAIFLDTVIDGHDYFYIPAKSTFTNDCEVTATVEKININIATASQLATLTYISTALGEKIVAYREENGLYKSIEEIMNVSGIGRATYERIRDYITLK